MIAATTFYHQQLQSHSQRQMLQMNPTSNASTVSTPSPTRLSRRERKKSKAMLKRLKQLPTFNDDHKSASPPSSTRSAVPPGGLIDIFQKSDEETEELVERILKES